MDDRIKKIREEMALADVRGLIHPSWPASDMQYMLDALSAAEAKVAELETLHDLDVAMMVNERAENARLQERIQRLFAEKKTVYDCQGHTILYISNAFGQWYCDCGTWNNSGVATCPLCNKPGPIKQAAKEGK